VLDTDQFGQYINFRFSRSSHVDPAIAAEYEKLAARKRRINAPTPAPSDAEDAEPVKKPVRRTRQAVRY
jgi:hypothetical protein